MDDITAYLQFIWTGAGAPSAAQWDLLRQHLPDQPFARAISTAARAANKHPNRALSFASQSPDQTRWLGQVTISGSATKSAVHDPADRQTLRARYEEAGGEQPAAGWDALTIREVLLQILDYWAGQHSVVGSSSAKLAGVLQVEARATGAALGFSAGQQANLSIETVFLGDPAAAQAAALALKQDENWS
jgi:hypothetical protein